MKTLIHFTGLFFILFGCGGYQIAEAHPVDMNQAYTTIRLNGNTALEKVMGMYPAESFPDTGVRSVRFTDTRLSKEAKGSLYCHADLCSFTMFKSASESWINKKDGFRCVGGTAATEDNYLVVDPPKMGKDLHQALSYNKIYKKNSGIRFTESHSDGKGYLDIFGWRLSSSGIYMFTAIVCGEF